VYFVHTAPDFIIMIYGNFIEYPDGTDLVVDLLKKFPSLTIRQVRIYLMQKDPLFNSKRTSALIRKLIDMNVISVDGNRLYVNGDNSKNDSLVSAFWVFLQFVDENTEFEPGMYPSEIVFQNDDIVSEIIVCKDDLLERLDFLSKRKKRKNKCSYYIVLEKDTIDDIDDSLLSEVPLTLVTMQAAENDIPKLLYHQVVSDGSDTSDLAEESPALQQDEPVNSEPEEDAAEAENENPEEPDGGFENTDDDDQEFCLEEE
jgi:hypothetical protein